MTLTEVLMLAAALSLPLSVVAVCARLALSLYRGLCGRRFARALASLAAMAGLVSLFGVVGMVWFGYGVGHGAKPVWEEAMLIVGSMAVIHGTGFGLWRLARRLDRRPASTDHQVESLARPELDGGE